MRLFVALPVPRAVREGVVVAASRLRPRLPAARWAPVTHLHLTLVFLGETEGARLPALDEALGRRFAGFAPLTLRLSGAGCFPPRRAARVAWIGFEPAAGLGRLQGEVAAAVAGVLERPPERRPFHPHLTLARCRRPWPRAAVELWASALAGPHGEAFEVSTGELVRSHLAASGARYETVGSYPLAAPPGARV